MLSPPYQDRSKFRATTTCRTSHPRSRRIDSATTDAGFEPRRTTLGAVTSALDARVGQHPVLGTGGCAVGQRGSHLDGGESGLDQGELDLEGSEEDELVGGREAPVG